MLNKLKRSGYFSDIEFTASGLIRIETKEQIIPRSKDHTKIKNKIKQITGSDTIEESYEITDGVDEREYKIVYVFADIDSTLTHTGTSTINHDVESIINKIKDHNGEFYFCSGRSSQNIDELIKKYRTGEYGIAENGGIIVGMRESKRTFGNRSEPKKLMKYLLKHTTAKIDPNQSSRVTEIVILANSIKEHELEDARKKTNANIEYHASKNTYHISEKGINKGTAIDFLANELHFDSELDYLVAIGDSDLDIPMFEHVAKGFLVEPNKDMKKKVKKTKKCRSGRRSSKSFERHV